ncbi:MAG: hypothetical protein ACRDV9_11225, partial [Acidimicrobiia bacterium]
MKWAVGLLMPATLVLTGCANSTNEQTQPKTVRPADLVAVEGPAPVGRFLIKAGPESLDSDLFRVAFDSVTYERITTDARVTTVGGCDRQIVVAAAQKSVGYVDTLQE